MKQNTGLFSWVEGGQTTGRTIRPHLHGFRIDRKAGQRDLSGEGSEFKGLHKTVIRESERIFRLLRSNRSRGKRTERQTVWPIRRLRGGSQGKKRKGENEGEEMVAPHILRAGWVRGGKSELHRAGWSVMRTVSVSRKGTG